MTPEQVGFQIACAVQGLQIAIIHLGTVLEQKNVISKADLANSFDATANLLSPNMISHEMSQKILRGIVTGLREARPPKLELVQ